MLMEDDLPAPLVKRQHRALGQFQVNHLEFQAAGITTLSMCSQIPFLKSRLFSLPKSKSDSSRAPWSQMSKVQHYRFFQFPEEVSFSAKPTDAIGFLLFMMECLNEEEALWGPKRFPSLDSKGNCWVIWRICRRISAASWSICACSSHSPSPVLNVGEAAINSRPKSCVLTYVWVHSGPKYGKVGGRKELI